MPLGRFTAAAVVVAFAAPSLAGDLDADEKAWVATCVANLSSKSERMRTSAEKAIGGMGLDALPAVLDAVGASKAATDGHALALAIAAMGKGATKALQDLRPNWPKFMDTSLGAVLTEVRSLEEKAEAAAAPKTAATPSPDDVDAQVSAILESYRGTRSVHMPDPSVAKIARLGHAAVGALMRALEDSENAEAWALMRMASSALAEVVDESDAPMLAASVRAGHADVEAAFASLRSPEAMEILAGLLREGQFGTTLDSVLEGKLDIPVIAAACCAWLERPVFEGDMDFAIAKMAEAVGGGLHHHLPPEVAAQLGMKPEPGVKEAVAPLKKLLERELRIDAKRRVASSLANLGDKSGIEALIGVLGSGKRPNPWGPWDYEIHAAGEHLNAISGTTLYQGKYEPSHSGVTELTGNVEEAAKAYRAWWETSKEKVRFDETQRKWVR